MATENTGKLIAGVHLSRIPTAPISLRRARESDARAIAELASELGYLTSGTVMRRRIKAVLGSEADLLIVAVDRSNKVVGWLQAHVSVVIESGFRAEIVGMIVSETARRGGVGRLLVAKAETWARKRSAPAMVVRSNIKRRASHKFYSALGYKSIKTQVVYRKALSHLAG